MFQNSSKIFQITIFSIIALLLIAAEITSVLTMENTPVNAQNQSNDTPATKLSTEEKKKLEGHIRQSGDATMHLSRPALPQTAPRVRETVQDKSKNTLNPVSSFSFDLSPKSLNGKADTSNELKQLPPSLQPVELSLEEHNGVQIINWDKWHKSFVENLYVQFHRANDGRTAGSSRVLVIVAQDGSISFQAAQDFYQQSTDYQNLVSKSFNMLSHSPTLEFPSGSKRSKVEFTINLRASSERGASSYGLDWKRGDLEKIHRH